MSQTNGKVLRVLYDCAQCPGYCCSYDRIEVTKKDITRLAKRFNLTYEQAEKKFTKFAWGERILRHRKDHVFKSTCQFFDQSERRCTIYAARPDVCREYPDGRRCAYFDFLKAERVRQQDPEFIPSA
ncbi:MAG: YkgJ family cysteine cluster protein [Acidobacteriota bacterium]